MTPLTPPRPRRRSAIAWLCVGAAVALAAFGWFAWDALQPRVDGRTVGQLRGELTSPDPAARRAAAMNLGRLNTGGADALPELVRVMARDSDDDVRSAAAEAIGKMAPASERAVEPLAAALSDPDPRVRMLAALALLRLREKARPAVPALIAAAADQDNDTNLNQFHHTVRQTVLTALGAAAAGTPDAVPTLAAVLDQPAGDGLRQSVAAGLGLAGEHARPVAPKLRRLLADPNADVRLAAGESLDRIGEPRDGEVARGRYDGLALPDAEASRLWDLEHAVNVMNRHGLAPLATGLRAGDAAAITRAVAADFAGREPSDAGRVRAGGFASVDRRTFGTDTLTLTRAAFADRLMGWRALFADPPVVSLATATLAPTDPVKPAGGWEGTVLVRLAGPAAGGGVAEVTATLRVVVTGVTEEVLGGPGWLRAVDVRRVAVARSPGPLFVDVTTARGLNARLHDNWTAPPPVADGPPPVVTSGGVWVCDYNRDGFLDLLVTDVTAVALYRGSGGRFEDVTAIVGLPAAGSADTCCWVDLDGDGWDDLLLAGRVYHNAGGKAFEDVTEKCTLPPLAGLSAALPADFDRDGKLDLYLTRTSPPGNQSWLEGTGGGGQGNRLFRNLGGWKFEDVTKRSGTHGGYKSSFTAAWLDADDDGWPDLHVPNEFGDGELYLNRTDGTFAPVRLAARPADFGTMGLATGDLDNDGRIDLYCANMYSKAGTRVIGNLKPDAYPPDVMAKLRRFVAGSELHMNRGGGKFAQVAVEKQINAVGWAYGPALADFDGDGFLDVYATAGYLSRDRRKPDG